MYNVITESLASPEPNIGLVKRFAGIKQSETEFDYFITDCLEKLDTRLKFKVCYSQFPIKLTEQELDLGFTKISSLALRKVLDGCDSIILFAATVGIEMDRIISRYSHISPTKGLLLQAIGAERIESLCDAFTDKLNKQLLSEEKLLRPRFSPGYGDLPLEFQRIIFKTLDCSRHIGVSLTESCIMCPTKSVTAIIGVSKLR